VGNLAPRPIFIIHSTGDKIVPYQHAIWLYEAAGEPKELWIVEDVAHCGAYFIDRPAYCRRVADFFARSLPAAQPPVKVTAFERNGSTPDEAKQPALPEAAPPAPAAPQPKREVRGIERAMD